MSVELWKLYIVLLYFLPICSSSVMASRFTSDLSSAAASPPTDIAKALAKTGSSVPPPAVSTFSVVGWAGSAGLAAPAPPISYFKTLIFEF